MRGRDLCVCATVRPWRGGSRSRRQRPRFDAASKPKRVSKIPPQVGHEMAGAEAHHGQLVSGNGDEAFFDCEFL